MALIEIRIVIALIEIRIVIALIEIRGVVILIVSIVRIGGKSAVIAVTALAESRRVHSADGFVAAGEDEKWSEKTEEDRENSEQGSVFGIEVLKKIVDSYVIEDRVSNARGSRQEALCHIRHDERLKKVFDI